MHQFNTRRKTVFCLQGNSVVYIIRVKEKQNDIIINKISSSFLKKNLPLIIIYNALPHYIVNFMLIILGLISLEWVNYYKNYCLTSKINLV